MTRLRSVWIAFVTAVRRLSARPLVALLFAVALASAGALIGWGSLAGALSSEDNVRVRLAELPSDERSVQTVYDLSPGEVDPLATEVTRFFDAFRDVTLPVRRVHLWHSVGAGIRLISPDDIQRDVVVSRGRLPQGCHSQVCEAVALTGEFRVGQLVPLGEDVRARIVGAGALRREALPVDSDALPRTPELLSRTLLVRSLDPPLERLVRDTGTSVVVSAALDPDVVHASDLRALIERLRENSVRLRRETLRVTVTAPFEELDDIANRGDVARIRLLLVAGQGAALVVAFAAFASAARKRESMLLDEQLETLGAARFQIRTARIVEVGLPCAAGALLAVSGLYLGAYAIARARGLPASFVVAGVPWWTIGTIAAATCVAVALLVVAESPSDRRRGVGPLELAAVIALAIVIWQMATTGALDPETIEEGAGVGPVLVLLPALAFFSAGVLVLRLLPLVLRRAEKLSRRASFGVRLGFLSAARRPGEAAAATTFLAIALGVALFGLDYRETLEHQARDEARFTAGAQWRVSEKPAAQRSQPRPTVPRVGTDVQPPSGADVRPITGQADVTPLSRYATASSEQPTPVLRLQSGVTESEFGGEDLTVELLGLPARRLSRVVGWKDDYSRSTLDEIGHALRPRRSGFHGLRLARDALELRAWMRSDADLERFVVLHFFIPARQRFVHVRIGDLSSEWRRLRYRLPAALRGSELVGVEFPPISVPLSAPRDYGSVEVAPFEQRRTRGWASLGTMEDWTASSAGGEVDVERDAVPARRRLRFSLEGTWNPLMRPRIPDAPLPALVSRSVAGAAVDGIVTLHGLGKEVRVRVIGTARLFPTVITLPSGFVVVDYQSLFSLLNVDQPGLALPTEAWFFEPQRTDYLERLAQPPFRVQSVVGVEPLTARLVNDPLGAGARDVLLTACLVAALLALLGIALTSRSSLAAERLLLAEYEALGVPPTTIARSLQVRLLVLSALGVVAGFLGALLAVRLVGAGVAVNGAGGAPLPPIEPVVAWRAGALLVGVLGGAALVVAVLLAARMRRETAAERLRA